MAATMTALKVEVAGEVTSFRYPHFTQGFQPTYEMPPPSTIYGHICSAAGRWLTVEERAQLRFAYVFKHNGKFIDYKEHLHFADPVQPFPFDRQLLFQPRLTLYLAGADFLQEAFLSPQYTVVLGRSQDLMTYQQLSVVTLEEVASGYFEDTLLPMAVAPHLMGNVSVATMARYIDEQRQPLWQSYSLLQGTAVWPPAEDDDTDMHFESNTELVTCWAEQAAPLHPKHNLPRIVCFHDFGDD